MDIDYDDLHERLRFSCHKCRTYVNVPPIISGAEYCAYCGHKFNFDKVNNIRGQIKELCYKEGHR